MTAIPAGTATVAGIQWRTSWKAVTGWVLGLTVTLVGTVAGIRASYDTPTKIHEYAMAVGSGDALVALNGRIAGIDSLGGVIANEFGFIAAFALPLMGISLMARLTRRDEEAGRTEQLVAGRITRAAPLVAAAGTTVTAILLASLAFGACLAAVGIPLPAATLYAASLGALAVCFAGVAGLAAQVMAHVRGVHAVGLGVLVLAYAVRGVGDVLGLWLTWLSPLGWAEKTQAFGTRSWWPLAVPLLVALGCLAVATRYAAARDVGSALHRARPLAVRASASLHRPIGLALHQMRGPIVGWSLAAAVVAGMFGSLTRQAADAIGDNPAVRQGLGEAGESGADILIHIDLVLLTLLAAAAALHGAGVIRAEETSGRLAVLLTGPDSRTGWLGARIAALLLTVLGVAVTGALVLGVSAAWSLGDWSQPARLARATAAQLPVALILAAAAVALHGVAPRWLGLAWAWFAGTAFVALLGAVLRLPGWVTALAPTEHVGNLPGGAARPAGLLALGLLAVLLTVFGILGFRRRDID